MTFRYNEMDNEIRSLTLKNRLSLIPQALLYHYTGPQALIGILREKELWATNTNFLNDFTELYEASNTAKNVIENIVRRPDEVDEEEKAVLDQMHELLSGSVAKRFYVCSFTEDRDSLPQWRAYCPRSGGYAIGFPSKHLASLARELGWIFVKCVYDHTDKYQIVSETVNSYVNEFRQQRAKQNSNGDFVKNLVWRFYQHLAQIGGAIKHSAFEKESEWRLISPPIPEQDQRIEFRTGVSSVVPYYRFPLVTQQNPNLAKHEDQNLMLRCGPTPHMNEAQQAAQFILTRYLGGAAHGGSDVPFNGW
jgi:Protein of unknown function (DUF2971)